MRTLSTFVQRFLNDPYGTAITTVFSLMFLAVGIALIVWGIHYAIDLFKEMSGK